MKTDQYTQMNPSNPGPNYQVPVKKEMLPGSLATLILGIVSLANMAFFGWIPAVIAYGQYRKAMEALEDYPDRYSSVSINMAQSGKKMADIGLVLGILGMIVTAVYYYWVFSTMFSRPSHMMYY